MKQRLQTGQFANVSAAVRGIVSKEGVRGLYAGHASFLLRDLPFDAIEFVAYEQVRADAHTHTHTSQVGVPVLVWSGSPL